MRNKYKIALGDCLDVMKRIPDNSVDFILTDPPYGTTACKWDNIIPFESMWDQIWRVLKPNGAVALFGSEPFSSALRMSQIKYFKYDWVWQKDRPNNFALANRQPMKYHELVSVFYRTQPLYNKQMEPRQGSGKARYKYLVDNSTRKAGEHKINLVADKKMYDPNLRNPSSVQAFSSGRRQDVLHPTQKPVALLEYLIKTYTNETEIVLDFTMGSGSTGVACINTNRQFIGIEKEEKYFEISKERLEKTEKELDNEK